MTKCSNVNQEGTHKSEVIILRKRLFVLNILVLYNILFPDLRPSFVDVVVLCLIMSDIL